MKITYKSIHGRIIEAEEDVPSPSEIREMSDQELREMWLISILFWSGEEALDLDDTANVLIED